MTTPNEPTFEQLVDWIENRLSATEAQQVAEQVAASAAAQAAVAWLRAMGQASHNLKLAQPPAAVRAALVEQFAQQANAAQRPGLFQRLVAALRFDSLREPLAAGVRAAEFGRSRQLVYATDMADVALNLEPRPSDQHIDLSGQILPNVGELAPDEFAVQLLHETREVGLTLADDLGEFSFAALPPGRYQLILSSATLDILLPPFELLR